MCAKYHSFDSSREPNIEVLRLSFFHSISKVAPNVWTDLKEDSLPACEKVIMNNENRTIGNHKMVKALLQSPKTSNLNDVKELDESLEVWGKRYNLYDEWILDQAVRLLEAYVLSRLYETEIDPLKGDFPSRWIGPDKCYKEKIDLNIQVSHLWDPTMFDENNCRYQLGEKIDKEIGRIKAHMDALGYIEEKQEKRNTADFDYLVEYQVNGSSYDKIVLKYKIAEKIMAEYQGRYEKIGNKEKLTNNEQRAYDVVNNHAHARKLATDRLYKSIKETAKKIDLTIRK